MIPALGHSRQGTADVVIAGGGPAGAATALALTRRGLSAVIVERSGYDGVRVGESLAPDAEGPLRTLGVWERFRADGHLPSLANLGAWGGPQLAIQEHFFHPYGQGWHLDRNRFDAMLAGVAREAGVRILTGAIMEKVERAAGGWRLAVRCGSHTRVLQAEWLVDATGRPASVARRLGGRRILIDRLVGVTAFLAPEPGAEPLDPAVLVETEEDGWWYSAPLCGGRAVAAFLTDAGAPRYAAVRDPGAWWQRLGETCHTSRRLRRFSPPTATVVRAASPAFTAMPETPRFLLVGDAAAAFDPISGMGINAALWGGLEAAEAIAAAREGRPGARREYEEGAHQRFRKHLAEREALYAEEDRWPGSSFWRTRCASIPR